MSRTYSASGMAMDGVRGAGLFMGVIALVLVALAGFADGYNHTAAISSERAARAQPKIALERAALMDPSELVAATPETPAAPELAIAEPVSTPAPVVAPVTVLPEPAVSTIATPAAPVTETMSGPV